jgi:hypothetical protein
VPLSGTLRSLVMAAGAAILLSAAPSALAQAGPDPEWTVLTVAHNGAWGVSTARSQGEAIAGALRQCQARSPEPADCGAELIAYKVGWALAILCGDRRVVVSAGSLDEAEQAAYERIAALKRACPTGLPPCHRLLTVDPAGAVTTATGPDG